MNSYQLNQKKDIEVFILVKHWKNEPTSYKNINEIDNYKIKTEVHLHPSHVHKVLFTSHQNGVQLYEVKAIIWEDGSRTFAKWWQDGKTGAFCITTIAGDQIAKQGGYQNFIPANCYKNESGEWRLNSSNKDNKSITYSSL